MIAISGQFRFVIAGVQVVGTLAAMGLGGVSAAVAQERHQVDQARATLAAADRDFHHQLQLALADGTASKSLEPLARAEWQVWRNGAERTAIVDRLLLDDLKGRAGQLRVLAAAVVQAERADELRLAGELGDALHALEQDCAAAHSAGVDAAAGYDQRRAQFAAWPTEVVVPRDYRARIALIVAMDAEVKDATTNKIAGDRAAADAAAAALQASRDNLAYQHDRAHGDLARALAITVLQVGDQAAAIAAADGRMAQAQGIDAMNAVAADFAVQSRALENLLYIRDSTYNQLARARNLAARAASLGVDVSSYVARLNAANVQLDAAGTVPAILAAADVVRDVNTALYGAYSYAVAHPPPPPGSVILNVPYFPQIYSLSCEEAALQMVLAYEGINQNQDAILANIGVDRTPPQLDGNGNVVHWGDPYANFVGDPNGYRESAQYGDRSGYGTYFSTIARAATSFGGHVLQANEGIKPQVLYDMLSNHHPAVVWVAWEYSPHPITHYQAFDGRVVMYGAPWEHAVALVGMSQGSVLINNPHGGQQWISKGTFEHAYEMFNQMAVIVS